MDGIVVARALLKVAAAGGLGRPLGKALRGTARTAGKVVKGSGEFAEDLAAGLGAGKGTQSVARLAGNTAALGAGYVGAVKVKNKADQKVTEFKLRHGLYRDPYAGTY